ncbi:hypothetical protein SteCoe_25124 [Stentor coeruleus]|uniref:Uncharacterized protein n=1 Tax=Stentor coeruleus TaxID=5963 RepID=A0A1R2BGC2_9CILI|nr:hypothetical protein SteCoe_25124 [Stentor coeruleus]
MNKYSHLEKRSLSNNYLPPLHNPLLTEESNGRLSPISRQFKVPKISTLTQLENRKINQTSNINPIFLPIKNDNIEVTYTQSNKDFISLLQSIDLITNGKEESYYKTLREGEIVSVSLNENMVHYFKVKCDGKRSPLKVNIRRNKGMIKTFVSKSVDRPNQENADYAFVLDKFEICENGMKFPYIYLYISIEALTDTEFSIGVTFGKIKNVYIPRETLEKPKRSVSREIEELRKNEELRNKFNKKVDQLIQQRKERYSKISGSKNFLKLNKNITVSSTDRLLCSWEEKKSQVLNRKYLKALEKKEQAIRTVNKKVIQSQLEQAQKEQQEKKEQDLISYRKWVIFLSLLRSASKFHSTTQENRNKIIKKLQRNAAARRIQKSFKGKFIKKNIKNTILLRLRSHLLMYWNNLYKPNKNFSNTMLIKTIRLSAVNNKTFFTFNVFIDKILHIQKTVKSFLRRTKFRLEEILKLWNILMAKLVSRGSTVHLNRYIKITSHVRNHVIKQYYSQKLNEYLLSQSKKSKNQVFEKKVDFKYLPSETILKQLIEQAAGMINS